MSGCDCSFYLTGPYLYNEIAFQALAAGKNNLEPSEATPELWKANIRSLCCGLDCLQQGESCVRQLSLGSELFRRASDPHRPS